MKSGGTVLIASRNSREKKSFLSTLSLYSKHDDHPIYGRGVLTYIGKAVDQPIITRLKQHDMDLEDIYVANIMRFENWSKSDEQAEKSGWDVDDFVKEGDGDADIISRIEELLIYSLRPADNIRNKNSAARSWAFRLFNTGDRGSVPQEVSGHYALHNAPNPNGTPTSKK